MEDPCKYFQFDVSDKTLTRFNALDRIFIKVNAFQLHTICQTALGQLWLGGFAKRSNMTAGDIIPAGNGLILEHGSTSVSLTFTDCHF